MTTDAFIRVICNECEKSEEEIQLTATARGWDERDVKRDIKNLGWMIVNDQDHCCPNCEEEEEEDGDD